MVSTQEVSCLKETICLREKRLTSPYVAFYLLKPEEESLNAWLRNLE